jgi:hypothetical protein
MSSSFSFTLQIDQGETTENHFYLINNGRHFGTYLQTLWSKTKDSAIKLKHSYFPITNMSSNSSSVPPPLPNSEPPKKNPSNEPDSLTYCADDNEINQILHQEGPNYDQDDLPVNEASSLFRLEADVTFGDESVPRSGGFLQPESKKSSHAQRRRSPVTVQEWVASLPIPHLLNRKR